MGISRIPPSLLALDISPVWFAVVIIVIVKVSFGGAGLQVIFLSPLLAKAATTRAFTAVRRLALGFAKTAPKGATSSSCRVGLDVRVSRHSHRRDNREASADEPNRSFHRGPNIHISGVPCRIGSDGDGR